MDLRCVAWQLDIEGIGDFTEAFDGAHHELEERRRSPPGCT